MLLIKNAIVFCEDGFRRGEIAIAGGLFARVRTEREIVEAGAGLDVGASAAPRGPAGAEGAECGNGAAGTPPPLGHAAAGQPPAPRAHGEPGDTAGAECGNGAAGDGREAAAGGAEPEGADGCEIFDAEGCYAIPGLIDIHFHGCAGYDFSSASVEEMRLMARYQAMNGVTAICPATMTLPESSLEAACRRMAELSRLQGGDPPQGGAAWAGAGQSGGRGAGWRGQAGTWRAGASQPGEEQTGASQPGGRGAGWRGQAGAGQSGDESALIGINLEGPFLSPEKLGAQNPAYIRPPDAAMFGRLQKAAGGLIRLLCVAPETEGALGMIGELGGVVAVSLAHTAAGYDLAKKAFAAGARHVTHLYNAMLPFAHREPGLPGAVFDTPGVIAELICDGVHIHPASVRATFRLLGDSRVVMVSDSMMATGMPDGMYELGGLPVLVSGGRAVLADGGSIAGSVTNLMGCLRAAVRDMGIPLHSAVKCAALNPARAIGAYRVAGGAGEAYSMGVAGNAGGMGGVGEAPSIGGAGEASGMGIAKNVVGAGETDSMGVAVGMGAVGNAGGAGGVGEAPSIGGAGSIGSLDGADSIGGMGGRGAILPGMVADLVLLDAELRIRHVFLRGRRLLGDGHSADIYSGDVHFGDGHSGDVYSADGHSADVHSSGGHFGDVHSSDGHSADIHSGDVHSGDGHSGGSLSGNCAPEAPGTI
ncbi:MAG: amidohydrolase family protein [Clostridiales bacterium]|jgi:N-acetylglucosamine-6-phosphate deacetylase|nr:amidohydrolase family protein [Clostridiales bacterium]